MRGGRDILRGDETLAQLIARGHRPTEAAEILAFSQFLRRAGRRAPDVEALSDPSDVDARTRAYALGQLTSREYLTLIDFDGRGIDLIGPERSEGPPLAPSASRERAARTKRVHAGHSPANPAKNASSVPSISASAAEKRGAVAGGEAR